MNCEMSNVVALVCCVEAVDLPFYIHDKSTLVVSRSRSVTFSFIIYVVRSRLYSKQGDEMERVLRLAFSRQCVRVHGCGR
jgi:hypothetical protein